MFKNKIVRADGTTEVLGIKQGSFHYHSQMETAGKIQVGNVISAFIEFSFYVTVNNGIIPVGEQIKYYQVTDVNNNFVETSTISENLIGTFNVTSSNTNKNICTIVAYDNISKLNVDYSLHLKEIQNQFPMRIRDLLDEAANYVGLTSNVGHYSRVDILYTGMLPAFYSDGITVRDLFVWAGTLVGDAIYAGAQGTIYQRSYGAKYNGQPWKYSHEYIIAPTDQDEYYNPSGLQQLIPVFYKQDSFHSEEYSVIPYDCVEVYKSDGSLFATYSPSGTSNKKYVVFGNVFLDFVDTPSLSTYANLVASDIYEYLQGAVKHSPMRVSLFPFRCPYGYGSGSTTYLYDIIGEVVSIPIMSLDLTDESVIIEVFGEDEENGKHRQDFTADERATNLSAQINAVNNNKVSKSGDTMTGSLSIDGKELTQPGQHRLLRIYGNKKSKPSEVPTVTSNSPYGSISMYDVDDNRLFYNECVLNSSGTVYSSYVVRRPLDNGTFVNNGFYLRVTNTGEPTMAFTSDEARDGWLSSLGLLSATTTTTVSNIITAGSSVTIGGANFAQFGKVAQLRVLFTPSADVSSSVTIGTLVVGKRPIYFAPAMIRNNASRTAYLHTNGSVTCNGGFTGGTQYEVLATYILV
jgi:hypothetical protein